MNGNESFRETSQPPRLSRGNAKTLEKQLKLSIAYLIVVA